MKAAKHLRSLRKHPFRFQQDIIHVQSLLFAQSRLIQGIDLTKHGIFVLRFLTAVFHAGDLPDQILRVFFAPDNILRL